MDKFEKKKFKPPPESLHQQLKNKKTNLREKIFFHKLVYDLMVSATNSSLNIKINPPHIDDEGYDISVDDRYNPIRKFQVKTKLKPGGATKWECHRQLFCPSMNEHSEWDIDEWNRLESFGYNGGFILMDIEWTEGDIPDITYYYNDLSISMAYRDGFSGDQNRMDTAKRFFSDMRSDPFNLEKKITLSQLLLVKPKSTKAMLSLMGFNIGYSQPFTPSFVNTYSRKFRAYENKNNDEMYKDIFFKNLKNQIIDS